MFITLYDIRTEGVPHSLRIFLLGGIIALLIGLSLIYSWKTGRRWFSKDHREIIVGVGFTFMGLLFVLISAGPAFLGPSRAKKIFDKKLYRIVEGYPQKYHPMPEEGHDVESFEIQGVSFHYGDYIPRFGYDNAASHGGVIHPRNYYRITYYPDQVSLEAGGPSILIIEKRQN
jgi:hypothetical protein